MVTIISGEHWGWADVCALSGRAKAKRWSLRAKAGRNSHCGLTRADIFLFVFPSGESSSPQERYSLDLPRSGDADDDNGDVVLAAALVGESHQSISADLQVVSRKVPG